MNVKVPPGKYVVAVSGGVDSIVLLDILSENKSLELIVAHVDHGIRTDSRKDCEFVAELAAKYGFVFESVELELGKGASEQLAREARYSFLQQIRKKYNAQAIITAHHKNDALETMALNILRGTGRTGASSLSNHKYILRPLLDVTKLEITEHAKNNKLRWREDSTNNDLNYTRNWIRHKVLPKLTQEEADKFFAVHDELGKLNAEIDDLLDTMLDKNIAVLPRAQLIAMPQAIASELVAHWLRKNGIRSFSRGVIDRVVHAAKTLQHGKHVNVIGDTNIVINKNKIELIQH